MPVLMEVKSSPERGREGGKGKERRCRSGKVEAERKLQNLGC